MDGERRQFLIVGPMYVLASDYMIDESTGRFVLDEKILFSSPEYGGNPCLALFTDDDNAERFREKLDDPAIKAFPLGADMLLWFIPKIAHVFHWIVIDPRHEARSASPVPLPEFLRQLQEWDDRGRPDDPTSLD